MKRHGDQLTVLAHLRMVVPLDKRNDVIKTLRSIVGPTRAEPGCISCHLNQDVENANVLNYVEEWRSKEDLNRHIRSDQYRKVMAAIDEATDPPEVRFHTIWQTERMEMIRKARDSPGKPD